MVGSSGSNKYNMPGGGELTIQGMDECSRQEIGRKTYRFVRRLMQNPETKARIRARAEEIRAQESQR